MKDKIKNIIFSFTLSIMAIIVILSIITLLKIKSISIADAFPKKEYYENKYLEIDNKVTNIKNEKCKNIIIKEINNSKKMFFESNMKLKDIYEINQKYSPLNNNMALMEKCNLKENEKEREFISTTTLDITMSYDSIINRYKDNYVLSFSINNDEFNTSTINAELISAKYLEIERINHIIEVVTNEK